MPEKIPRWADALLLALLAVYVVAGAAVVPFHGDESTLLYMGRDYHYLFVEGDLAKVFYDDTWSRRPNEQRLRLENGTISKTIYGWLAWNQGYGPGDLKGEWHWGRDYEFNKRTKRVPDAQLLNVARMASAIQLALATALFFEFTRLTVSGPTAYLASLLFALHPNVLINGRRAMMEGSHLLGLMLTLLAGVWLLRSRRWWAFPLLGACMGIAVAAKHPNALIAALVFISVTIAIWWEQRASGTHNRGSGWRRLIPLLPTLVVAAAVFLLLNPAWWSAPFELPHIIVKMRAELLRVQVDWIGGYESFAQRIQGFFQYVFAAERQYFEVAHWAEYDVIAEQIKRYESSGLAGNLFGGTSLTGLICLLAAAFGAIHLARDSAIEAKNRLLLLVWMIGLALVTLLLTPLPWARYYLPLAPALAILLSYALIMMASAFWNRYSRKENGIDVLD